MEKTQKSEVTFSLHSIKIDISGIGASELARDFEFYSGQSTAADQKQYSVRLHCVERAPTPKDLPARPAERIFSECVAYREGSIRFFEYPGATLQVDRQARTSSATLITRNRALQRELAYLYLQSEIGRFLDAQGLHRVHALGIGLPSGKAALLLLPSGGGKSTMALEFVKLGHCTLLSDDSPLIDRRGNVYPYPMRLGFRPQAKIPSAWREKSEVFERRKHGPKTLVPVSALPKKMIPGRHSSFKPGFLVIGKRHGQSAGPSIERLSLYQGVFPLFRDLVVGLGVAQVAELILSDGIKSVPGLAPIALSRTRAAAAYSLRAKTLCLNMSRNPAADAKFLLEEMARL